SSRGSWWSGFWPTAYRCGWDCNCTNSFGTRRRRASERGLDEVLPAVATGRTGRFGRFLTGGMFDGNRAGEDNRVRNNDLAPLLGGDYGCARLNVVDHALNAGHADQIADAKWLLQKQQDAGEKILQDVLKSEADGDAADTKNLDQIGCLKRRSNHRESYQEAQNDDADVHQPAEEQGYSLMLASLNRHAAHQRFAKPGHGQEHQKNDAGDEEVRYERNRLIDDANAGTPGAGEIDGHANLPQLSDTVRAAVTRA